MAVGVNAGCVTIGRSGEWAPTASEVPGSSISRVLNLTWAYSENHHEYGPCLWSRRTVGAEQGSVWCRALLGRAVGCARIGWTRAQLRRRQWAATTAAAMAVSGLEARGRAVGLRSLSSRRGGGGDGGQGN